MRNKYLIFLIYLLFAALFFALAIKGTMHQDINLKNLETTSSIIIEKGVEQYKIRYKNSLRFYLKLKGLDLKLGVKRLYNNYNELLYTLNEGDTITVWYKRKSSESLYRDLIQIEKNGTVILNKKEYEEKESTLITVGLIGALCMLVLAWWKFKQNSTPKTT